MRLAAPMFLAAALALSLLGPGSFAQQPDNGVVQVTDSAEPAAWDAVAEEWTDLETFWLRYAERSGGLTWGRSAEYPPYADVKEFDTLLIELPQGACLMEFFHSRWRRANDVQRWDDAFNDFGACPFVFD